MATILIRINQTGQPDGTPGSSRDNIVVGSELQVTDTGNAGGAFTWTYVSPHDSVAVPTGLGTNDVRVTPDVVGTYLFFLDHDGVDFSYEVNDLLELSSTQGGASVNLPDGTRLPTSGETEQFVTWSVAVNEGRKKILRLRQEDVAVGGGPFTEIDFRAIGGSQVDITTNSGTAIVTMSGGAGGGTSIATAISTTGADVVVSASSPPTVGQGLVATSPTVAEWQDISAVSGPATQLQNDTTVVTISGSPAPTVGQALVAISSTEATWQDVSAGPTSSGSYSGALEFVDVIEISSDTQSVSFGAAGDGSFLSILDGDEDKVYTIQYVFNGFQSSQTVEIRPNGQTTDLVSAYGYVGSSTGSTTQTTWEICSTPASSRLSAGTATIFASTGKPRTFHASGVFGIVPESTSSIWSENRSGIWDETVTNITSIDIRASVANGLKSGSSFKLFKHVDTVSPGGTSSTVANSLATTGAEVTISGSAPPTAGQVLKATSSTSATWQDESGGGGGGGTGWEFCDSITVSGSNTASVSFNGVSGDGDNAYQPAGNTDVEYEIVCRIDKVSTSLQQNQIEFNGDTGSNYNTELMQVSAGGVVGSVNSDARISNSSAWTNIYCTVRVFAKVISGLERLFKSQTSLSNGSNDAFHQRVTGVWSNTTDEITHIKIKCTGTTNIGIGSEFHLYKRTPGA